MNDAEKKILATIKSERAVQKTEKAAREAQITEMKTLMEKVKSGTTLTADEQTKVDTMKKNRKEKNIKMKKGRF